jgi:translation initiation factor IF-3
MIRASKVRLISSGGEQLGIMSAREALSIANEEGLDLVEVAPNGEPPVCKIMDYGKFKYHTNKKVQDARKKSKAFQLKEVKFRPHTDEHDLEYKIRNIKKFLNKKQRVKLTVMFKGREAAYKDIGISLLDRVAEKLADEGTIDQAARDEGRNVTMVIVPK